MIALLLATTLAHAGYPEGLGNWNVLTTGDVWVGCTTHMGEPWCRSVGVIRAPVAKVAGLLDRFPVDPSPFKRVAYVTVLKETSPGAPDGLKTLHIVLDMPFPISHRDYVATFLPRAVDDTRIFDWKAEPHPEVTHPGAVRLDHAEGQWHLAPTPAGHTRLTYTWAADLGGDFPEFAFERAWATWGAEVIDWLRDGST